MSIVQETETTLSTSTRNHHVDSGSLFNIIRKANEKRRNASAAYRSLTT